MITRLEKLASIITPSFAQGFIYMVPVEIGTPCKLPDKFKAWESVVDQVLQFSPAQSGTAFVTIDERIIPQGETHRRPGAHVDGNYFKGLGWGGGAWQRNDHTGGVFLLSSDKGAVAWEGEIDDEPTPWINEGSPDSASDGGDCEHMKPALASLRETALEPNTLYWMNSGGIHESIPVAHETRRSLLRITLPPDAPQLAMAA